MERTVGYKVMLREIVSLESLTCPFCKLLMRAPIQTYRAERACGHCYRQAKQDTTTCPIDGEPLEDFEFFADKYKTRVIMALKCYCSNREHGCKWQGTVGGLEEHETLCWLERVVHCKLWMGTSKGWTIEKPNYKKVVNLLVEPVRVVSVRGFLMERFSFHKHELYLIVYQWLAQTWTWSLWSECSLTCSPILMIQVAYIW